MEEKLIVYNNLAKLDLDGAVEWFSIQPCQRGSVVSAGGAALRYASQVEVCRVCHSAVPVDVIHDQRPRTDCHVDGGHVRLGDVTSI